MNDGKKLINAGKEMLCLKPLLIRFGKVILFSQVMKLDYLIYRKSG